MFFFFFFQAEDGIRDVERSRGLGDVYKRQGINAEYMGIENMVNNVQSIEMRLAELASLEEKLVESENQYLEVTAKIGNIIEGWEAYLNRKGKKPMPNINLFSRSTTTARFFREVLGDSLRRTKHSNTKQKEYCGEKQKITGKANLSGADSSESLSQINVVANKTDTQLLCFSKLIFKFDYRQQQYMKIN
eukprot:TRINITY_DN6425_c0_g1_i3.p1 TRINITY_DN6425_c0_g1~~TRINITY_DN6425_c0_g1_i3.p1  ORF type:complete len:190 (-),score=42.99 TRINITY_DN6425_c0_g1_i3:23-592(-)